MKLLDNTRGRRRRRHRSQQHWTLLRIYVHVPIKVLLRRLLQRSGEGGTYNNGQQVAPGLFLHTVNSTSRITMTIRKIICFISSVLLSILCGYCWSCSLRSISVLCYRITGTGIDGQAIAPIAQLYGDRQGEGCETCSKIFEVFRLHLHYDTSNMMMTK